MVQILDDERQEPVVAGGLREETGREHWGFNVGKGQDLLCPPTVGGGCTFCPSEQRDPRMHGWVTLTMDRILRSRVSPTSKLA
jgi:hypothetical protein